MANDAVEGKRMVVLLGTANTLHGPYDLIVCLTQNSYARSANVINASTKCGDKKVNGDKDRTIELEGEIEINSDAGRMSEYDLDTIFENDSKVSWLFGPESPIAGEYYYEGIDAIISNLTISAPNEGNTTFSATLQLSGTPTKTIHAASS